MHLVGEEVPKKSNKSMALTYKSIFHIIILDFSWKMINNLKILKKSMAQEKC